MEPDLIYQAIDYAYPYYQLARDDVPLGWIELLSLTLSFAGAGCQTLHDRPAEPRPLTDFSGLCFFSAQDSIVTFHDSALTEPFGTLAPDQPYVVLWKTRESFFTSMSHAGPSFYVPASKVNTFGACDSIPSAGTVTTGGSLWSRPDGREGEKVIFLAAGQKVYIQGDPVSGNRPPEAKEEGAWYPVIVEMAGERIPGWVWSALLSFD